MSQNKIVSEEVFEKCPDCADDQLEVEYKVNGTMNHSYWNGTIYQDDYSYKGENSDTATLKCTRCGWSQLIKTSSLSII